jgi:hypothetical protein
MYAPEVSRIDWVDANPWERVHVMQRNRVMLDSPKALRAALHSSARHNMHADSSSSPLMKVATFTIR